MNRFALKKLIRESAKRILSEAMRLYVKDASYQRYDNLLDIQFAVMRPVWQYIEKLPKDQQDYFRKNGLGPETMTPDGDGYDKPTGILNLYISGFTRSALIDVMKIIFAGLKKLGLTWGKIKKEQSRMFKSQVIRIPIVKNPWVGKYAGPPEIQYSNINAYQIFHNILQYEGEHEFSMKADELMERIATLLKHDPEWIDKHIIHPYDSAMPDDEQDLNDPSENPHMGVVNQVAGGLGGARMIGGGLGGNEITRRLLEIYKVAKWAKEHGHEDLYVT